MRTVKWVMVITTAVMQITASRVNAEYIFDDVETLRGMNSLFLYVHSLPPQAEAFGLTQEQIQSDVDAQLQSAGIPVVSYRECCDIPGSPYLFVGIGLVNGTQPDIYAATAHLELRQVSSLEREPESTYHATTWMRGETVLAQATTLESDLKDLLKGWIKMFIYDYRSVNNRNEGSEP
jgi:hypothetical protein